MIWKGRMNRATYWLCVGILVGLFVAFSLFSSKPPTFSEVLLFMIAAPRLHDIGKSAWWAGGAFLGELAVLAITLTTLPFEIAKAVMGLYVLTIAGLMIWLGTIRGQSEPNRFGEPPAAGISWKPPSAS